MQLAKGYFGVPGFESQHSLCASPSLLDIEQFQKTDQRIPQAYAQNISKPQGWQGTLVLETEGAPLHLKVPGKKEPLP